MANREREPVPGTPADWLFDVLSAAVDLIPGVRLLRRGFERRLLRDLEEHLGAANAQAGEPESRSASASTESADVAATPSAILSELLERSMEQTPEEAREHAFVTILRQLVPDEARILGALSDGGSHPVLHVTAASTLGASTRRLLSNVSSIGQAAGVQLREMTPHYISHLVELGLVELAPENPELALKYEILESNTQVREALAQVGRREKLSRARIVRRTVRLTELGRKLWVACQPPAQEKFAPKKSH